MKRRGSEFGAGVLASAEADARQSSRAWGEIWQFLVPAVPAVLYGVYRLFFLPG